MAAEGLVGMATTGFAGQRQEVDANEAKSMDEDELKKIFRMFDADGSGWIDVDELADAMRVLGVKCSANSAKKVLNSIDSNQNGQVEWEEFYDFFSKIRDPSEIKQLLAVANQRFLDYKMMVEGDPNFGKRFMVPPVVEALQKYQGHNDNVEDVCWINDTQFLTVSLDEEIKIWDASNGSGSQKKELRTITGADAGIYTCFVIEGDKPKVMTGLGSKKANLWLWELGKDEVIQKYSGHESALYSVHVADDKRFGLSGSKLGRVCFHDLQRADPLMSLDIHSGVVYSAQFNEDCTTILSTGSDGDIKVHDLKSMQTAKSVVTIEDAAATGVVYNAIWRKEYEVISCGDDYCIKRWDIRHVNEGPLTNYFGHTSSVRCIALDESQEYLVSSTNDGCIRVWCVDETTHIMEEQDKIDQQIERAEQTRKEMEQILDEDDGTADIGPKEIKEMVEKIKGLYDQSEFLQEVKSERETLYCIQSTLGLCGHCLPVAAMSLREDPKDRKKLNLVSGGQDQVSLLFQFEKPDLTKFQKWDCDFSL